MATFAIWAALAGIVAFWTLTRPMDSDDQAGMVASSAVFADSSGMQALLGAVAPPVQDAPRSAPASVQYALVGVLAGTRSGQGAVLIAVDDQPARTYRVGSVVDGDDRYYLQSVQGRKARLGGSLQGPASLVLELPEFSPSPEPAARPAATGRSPRPGMPSVPSARSVNTQPGRLDPGRDRDL